MFFDIFNCDIEVLFFRVCWLYWKQLHPARQ